MATAATIAAAAAADGHGEPEAALALRRDAALRRGRPGRAGPRRRRPAAAPSPGRGWRRAGRPPTGRGGRPRTGRRAPAAAGGLLLRSVLLLGGVLGRGALRCLVRGALVRRGGRVRRRERVGRVRLRRSGRQRLRLVDAAAAASRPTGGSGWVGCVWGCWSAAFGCRSRRSQGWSSSVCPPWSRYITPGRAGGSASQNLGIGCEFRVDRQPGRTAPTAAATSATSRSPRARRPRRSTRTSTTLRPGPGRRARAADRRRR